jgi:hypothetical protein
MYEVTVADGGIVDRAVVKVRHESLRLDQTEPRVRYLHYFSPSTTAHPLLQPSRLIVNRENGGPSD